MFHNNPRLGTPEPAIAYSYLRLSSKRQANKADSKTYRDGFRRQIMLRDDYLAVNTHLTLDTRLVLHDIGVSGFTNANAAPGGQGKLAAFMAEVDAGRIDRGSYLLVESLDRMTRQQVSRAQALLLQIVNAGIVVVSLADSQEYREDAHPMQFIISIMSLTRAHEESLVKSKRLRQTWAEKRRKAGERKLSGRCPSWLTLVDGAFSPVDDRVVIVREILGYLAGGWGRDKIARILNARGEPTWGHGRCWHGGTVQKVTDNEALIGRFQPHRLEYVEKGGITVAKRVPDGPAIEDYFPRVVDEDLWERSRAVAIKRRLGKAPNSGGPIGTVVTNLFGTVATCSVCNAPMNYRDRGPRSTPVLRCSNERGGACTNAFRIPYRETEDAVLSWLVKVDLAAGARTEAQHLESRLKAAVAKRDALQAEGEAIVQGVGKGSRFSAAPLARIEAELGRVEAEMATAAATLRVLRASGRDDERKAAVIHLFELNMRDATPAEKFAARARIRQTIRETVTSMRCEPDGHVRITTVDGSEHLFRDGFIFDAGRWWPWAGGFLGLHPKMSKAEAHRRAEWYREFMESIGEWPWKDG